MGIEVNTHTHANLLRASERAHTHTSRMGWKMAPRSRRKWKRQRREKGRSRRKGRRRRRRSKRKGLECVEKRNGHESTRPKAESEEFQERGSSEEWAMTWQESGRS